MRHMVHGPDCHIQDTPMESNWLWAVLSVAPSWFLFFDESNKDLLLGSSAAAGFSASFIVAH